MDEMGVLGRPKIEQKYDFKLRDKENAQIILMIVLLELKK